MAYFMLRVRKSIYLLNTKKLVMKKLLILPFLFLFETIIYGIDLLAVSLEYKFTLGCAKVKYGEMIADMRGKVNGTVHSKNRFGAYMRNKTSPVNPQTTFQSAVRNSFTQFAQGWRSLTQAQRLSWSGAVDSFAKTNVFGDLTKLTGSNLYMSINRILDTIGSSPLTSPPLPAAVEAVDSMSVAALAGAGTMIVTYAPAIAANQTTAIFATAPVSAGVNFVKNKYRHIENIVTADASPYDIATAYEAKFGTGWKTAGQKVFVKMVPVLTAEGIKGLGLDASTIVGP